MTNRPSRRTVLKSVSVLGAGSLLNACYAASAQTQQGVSSDPTVSRTLENQRARVRLHRETLSGAQPEHILPDGKIQPSTLNTGEIVWRWGDTHVGHDLGRTDLWVIAIEPK